MAEISIKNLYNEVFGITPKYLVPRTGGVDMVSDRGYGTIQSFESNETAFSVSELGTPIYSMLSLQSGTFNTFEVVNGVPVKKKKEYPAYHFEWWPMVDVSQDKVIITTAVNGRDGTIKEYIYTDDFQVTIRGVLIGDGNNYPYEKRKELNNAFKINDAYGVVSRPLNDLGIFAIVLKNIQFQDVEGYNNVCQFTIPAISDMDVLLAIKEKRKL